MKKKKGFDLKEEYKKSWNYIYESRNFIYAVIGIFLVFAMLGFFVPVPEEFAEMILNFLEELLKQTEGFGIFEMARFIFLNNLQSSFFGMILGVFIGIFPILFSGFNGYVLGFVASLSVQQGGLLILWRLFPHGIFELPAVFISFGLGLKFGTFLFQKKKAESFRDFFWNSARVFVLIIFPLLVIAAIIESVLMFS